jgi:hypothetical protein
VVTEVGSVGGKGGGGGRPVRAARPLASTLAASGAPAEGGFLLLDETTSTWSLWNPSGAYDAFFGRNTVPARTPQGVCESE